MGKADDRLEAKRRQYRARRRRTHICLALCVLAIGIAVSHVLEHAGAFRLLAPPWQDVLLGYPTAGVLAVAGLALLPAT